MCLAYSWGFWHRSFNHSARLVPYLKAGGNKGGDDADGTGVSEVGYGTDDSRLGGPFIGDNSVVFQSEAVEKNYWKVETKDHYTGKGWIPSTQLLSKLAEMN